MRLRPIALFLVATALLAACSSGPGSGGTLEGTKWVLRSFEQAGELVLVPEAEYADAEFGASRVRGFGGCNDFTAAYRAGGRTLLISQTASTLAACAEGSMTFEQTYLALLDSSRFYSARRDTLTIYDEIGSTVLVFDAAPRNALLGHWRVDSFATGPGAVSAVLPDTELEVVFGIGSVGGSAGCNSFSGTYGTNGNVVRVGQLATTRKACPEEVMAQEAAFLEALQGIALIDPRAESVNLTDLDGALAVALIRPGAAGAEASPSLGSPPPSASSSPSEDTGTDEVGDACPDEDAGADDRTERSGTVDRTDRRAESAADRGALRSRHHRRGHGREHRLSGQLVHSHRADRPCVPVLRPGADRGAGRPSHPHGDRPGLGHRHDVRGCRRGGDRSCRMERHATERSHPRWPRGDAGDRDSDLRRGRDPRRDVACRLHR